MATPTRRGLVSPISAAVQLVAKDDLDGTAGTRRSIDATGASRVLIIQEPALEASDGTAGIDVIAISKDGGYTLVAESTTALLVTADDITGTILAAGVMNAAGVEPLTARSAVIKCGPYEGPTLVRICRKAAGAFGIVGGVAWVTHAPAVNAILIGGTPGTPTTVTHTAD
jgi:hypothetical protein